MSQTPQDRKPSAADQKKAQQATAAFLDSGLDLSPFSIDAGDGIEWEFKADPLPADISRLRKAQIMIQSAEESDGDLEPGFDALIDAIRGLIVNEEQKKKFPQPLYGVNALVWFTGKLLRGRSGFPTGG